MEHRSPMYSGGQVHVNPPCTDSIQLPAAHGFGGPHPSIRISHRVPYTKQI